MKKLIALLTALLFSAFAGIAYVAPKDDEFYYGESAYFHVPNSVGGGEVMYKQLYQSVFGSTDNSVERCDTTRVSEPRDAWVQVNTHENVKEFNSTLWDPVYCDGSVTVETTDSEITYTLTKEANIFAPVNGEIDTSHYACDYGHKMDFKSVLSNGDIYVTHIEGAKCWYCCAKKTVPEDGRYTATAGTLKGQKMAAGDMLCVGQAGTTVTITRLTQS